MARKKLPPKGPSNAYLISFGDTMTTLLAFFIVLNSLAEDQTGADLYQGTGSFSRAMNSFGLAGNLPGTRGKTVVQQVAPAPDYVVPGDEESDSQEASGPDENANDLRVMDRELEDFQRFINEMSRLSTTVSLPTTQGEAAFDFYDPLRKTPPLLSTGYQKALSHVLPLLRRRGYRTEIVVWSTTPSRSAWTRAAQQADQIGEELAQMANLSTSDRERLSALARLWITKEVERPLVTVVVRRVREVPPSN